MSDSYSSERRPLESEQEFQRRVIDGYERKNALPRMTLKFPMNSNAFAVAMGLVVYPDSEVDEDGNIVVLKKSSISVPKDYIYLEVKGVRTKFRFTGEGNMNFENDVLALEVEFVGLP